MHSARIEDAESIVIVSTSALTGLRARPAEPHLGKQPRHKRASPAALWMRAQALYGLTTSSLNRPPGATVFGAPHTYGAVEWCSMVSGAPKACGVRIDVRRV